MSSPTPGDVTASLLEAIYDRLSRIEKMLNLAAIPDERMTGDEVCRELRISKGKLKAMAARELFSDARPPSERVGGVPRLYFSTEVAAYSVEGVAGVARVKRKLGRK